MDLTKKHVLQAVRRAPPDGWKMTDLARALSIDGRNRHRLRRLLQELQEVGDIERGPGARYRVPGAGNGADEAVRGSAVPAGSEEARTGAAEARTGAELGAGAEAPKGAVTGRIRVHPAGYGFVERDDGEVDVFIPARFRGTALDGDRVRVATWAGYKGVEGRVEEVIARGRAKLTGLARQVGKGWILEPDDPRIASTYGHVALEVSDVVPDDGLSVVAEITRYPTAVTRRGAPPELGALVARVTHVLGDPDDPRTEVAKVIACAGIPDEFPGDVLAAADRAPPSLRPEDFSDRVDLRDRPFLTIDPETARDFDDAVFVEDQPGGRGWRIWVAVADVSHYVSPGGALDREARVRGCSVYLPDRAIPMLPKELSAGICSLNPEVDRCAMVARIDVGPDGEPGETAFCAAVIRSHARLDYGGAAAALSGDFRGPRARYRQWADALARANACARKMRARRMARGALDFDLPEAFVVLDEDDPRRVRDVRRQKSSEDVKVAYQLVEEFMLAANEAVARFFQRRGVDTIWRVHDLPDPERLEAFAALAEGFGVRLTSAEAGTPRGMKKVLTEIAGKPHERALNFLLLRSLKQATYDVVNVGHFGLASSEYLHFTSPIRRYPDLIVHRLLKHHLQREGIASGGKRHGAPPSVESLQAMASESSGHERRAVEAEREIVDMYRAFLMRDRIGEELDGIVSGVTGFGLFIECQEPFVEGLIRLERLGEGPWDLDEDTLRLVGRRSGRAFGLGMAVRVRVEDVSVARRRIDLALIEGGEAGEPLERRGSKRRERAKPPARPERGKGERARQGGKKGRRR
jgi:ribonuclease R